MSAISTTCAVQHSAVQGMLCGTVAELQSMSPRQGTQAYAVASSLSLLIRSSQRTPYRAAR